MGSFQSMSAFVIGFAVLFGSMKASAQVCDQRVNPHSFACAEEAFVGHIFPMEAMNGDVMQGGWVLLTYADASGVEGPEFRTLVNPQNPRIPEGVVNQMDGSRVGPLDWFSDRISMADFGVSGRDLSLVQGSVMFRDPFTVDLQLADRKHEKQGLQCRLFIRNQNEHLLCRWFSRRPAGFVLRGYLGFLRERLQ